MAIIVNDAFSAGISQLNGFSLPQRIDEHDIRLKEAMQKSGLLTSFRPNTMSVSSVFSLDTPVSRETLEREYQQGHLYSTMSVEEQGASNLDPIVKILAAFRAIPSDYHIDLFNDFQEAAESHDLRRLLDTISDWAATAELYAHPTLAAELREAIGGRKGVADWLPG